MPESTEALLISIVRRPREIFALVSERDAAKAEEPRPYAIKSKPLDRTSRTLYPRKDKLQESWRRLAKVTASDEETLYDLLIVAIESAPDLSIVHSPPPFPSEWAAPAARVKPTSAHPRAFQGTKHQPPKGARLVPFDARPYLCDVASLRKLLTPLAKFYPKVRARLKRCGYSTNTLDGIEGELQLVPQTQGAERRKCWTMPARFVQHIWPQVRWRAPRDVSAHVSLYGALELEKDERLLASVSRLIAASESGHACAWCGLAIALPIHRRPAFIEVLLELRPDTNPPKAAVQGQLEKVNALSSDEQFSMWVRPFLETLRDGASAEYLIAGFRLAAQFCPRYPFGGERNCDNFPEQIVEEIGIELAHVESDSWLPLTLWTLCGRFPGMDVVIRNSAWRSFTPDAAYRYFRLFAQLASATFL